MGSSLSALAGSIVYWLGMDGIRLRLEVDGSGVIHVLPDGPIPTEPQMEGTLC